MEEKEKDKEREKEVDRHGIIRAKGVVMVPDDLKLVAIGIMLYEQMMEAGDENAVWEDGEVSLDVELDALFMEETLRIISTYDFSGSYMQIEYNSGETEEDADADTE